jgi:hypothetical protein
VGGREQGRWTFVPPLGYLNAPKWSGKSLAPDPDRAPLVTRAFGDFATGRFTKEEVLPPSRGSDFARAKD